MKTSSWRLALIAAAVTAATPGLAQQTSLRAGVDAWTQGNYEEAVRQWRPLADRGDPDAQFNLGQAYKLGRGVPLNMTLAEQWYERAARQGHVEAATNLGLIWFQNGRRAHAMPYIQQGAQAGDARAQYVLGTALFNGDIVAQDRARAYAFMTRAAADGYPPAVQQLQAMEPHLTAEERARGEQLAQEIARDGRTQLAAAEPAAPSQTTRTRERPLPPRVAEVQTPPRAQPERTPPRARPEPQPPRQPQARPTPPTPAPAAQGGRWRIQLGAFSSEAAARSAWSAVSGRLPGARPMITRAGALFRLQAGGFASRDAAQRACAAARTACFPVAP